MRIGLWVSAAVMACLFVQGVAASTVEINREIKQLRSVPLVKGEMESTADYEARKRKLFQQASGRPFSLQLPAQNARNAREKMVSYDPDTRELVITMPELNQDIVYVDVRGEREIAWVSYSFLETEVGPIKSSRGSALGLAVLSASNPDLDGESWRIPMSPEEAKPILAGGKVNLEFVSDLHEFDTGPYWKPSLLLVTADDPRTMNYPMNVAMTLYLLPVRLLSLTLRDAAGKEIFRGEGSQINSPAIYFK